MLNTTNDNLPINRFWERSKTVVVEAKVDQLMQPSHCLWQEGEQVVIEVEVGEIDQLTDGLRKNHQVVF